MKTVKNALFLLGCVLFCASHADAQQMSTFSFPIDSKAVLSPANKPTQVDSQSFWFETSGAALKKGINIPTTAPGAMMLITTSAETNGALELDARQLRLSDVSGLPMSAKTFSEAQMAQTGLFSRSVAIQAPTLSGKGQLRLRSAQALPDDAAFVIRVREPESSVILEFSADGQTVSDNKSSLARMRLTDTNTQKGLKLTSYSASLVAPDGTELEVTPSETAGQVHFSMPDGVPYLAPKFGLYELRVSAKGMLGNLPVQRNAKIALAAPKPTASLSDASLLGFEQPTAAVKFQVNEPGRYEVRMVLFGTSQDGSLKPVMETHAAQDLNTGMAKFLVPFDENLLQKADVKGPYGLGMVRLFDQNQLGLLGETLSTQPATPENNIEFSER